MIWTYEPELEYERKLEEGCVRCDRCREIVPQEKTETIGEETVCMDCVKDVCDSYAEELRGEYIERHQKEFYLDRWFPEISTEDQVCIAKNAYHQKEQKESQRQGSDWLECAKQNEIEFCVTSSDWEDFVKETVG